MRANAKQTLKTAGFVKRIGKKKRTRTAYCFGQKLASESKYEQALLFTRRSSETANAYFADESNLVLGLTTNVATILFGLKEYNKAEVFCEESLPLAENFYGAKDARVADIIERLAQLS